MSDVEALRYAAGLHAMTCNDNPGHQDWHDCATTGPCADEGRRLASVLALLPAPHPQGGTEALLAAVETWRDRLLASTTFWVDDLAAHDVARQLTNLLESEDCPHLAESGDEGPVVDLPGGWPVRWRCDGCNRVRYDDAALAELRALLAAAPAPRGFCSCIDRPAADCGIPEHRVAAAPAPTEGGSE